MSILQKRFHLSFVAPALIAMMVSATPLMAASHNGFFDKILPRQHQQNIDSQKPLILAQASDPRVNDLEQQIRNLTGRVEELTFVVQKLREEVLTLQGKNPEAVSVDLGKKEYPPLGDAPDKDKTSRATLQPEQKLGAILYDEKGNIVGQSVKGEEQPTRNAEIKQHNIAPESLPVEPAAPKGQKPQPLPDVPQTAQPRELYDMGYRHILAGEYRSAEAVFRAYLLRYPSDPDVADASFWLGESLYAQGRYREAAQTYLDIFHNYTDSPRQPENLLKLSMSLAAMGDKDVACRTLGEIGRKYSAADPAVLKRVKDEQSRNKCR